jgi:putative peptide zinc metalloprotease protein
MTATAEPPARVEAPAVGALARADGIELLGDVHGSGYESGAALVRRADGQMVQLGPLMYALLECVDGRRSPSELAACLSEHVGRELDDEHVVALAEKLAAQGLLAGHEDNAPPRANPLLALHWKLLVTNPKVTERLTAPFTVFFRPWVMWPVLVCFVGVCWFVLVEKGVASATRQAFDNPELLLLVFLLAVASAGFHELGHASACRYGGGRPGGMGCGIYMVWPAFYTDVTDAYRLPRRDRLRTDLGGLYFNAIVAVATLGVWLLWRVDALLLLIALQLLQMVKQLSPVIRADGYHILADATGIPDLYAHIGPTLRRLVPWRRSEPSALRGRARVLVTAWVLVVVPVLVSLALGGVILLPRLIATAWNSGSEIAAGVPHEIAHAQIVDLLTSFVRLLALVLPVLGVVVMGQKLARSTLGKARSWSSGRPLRQTVLAGAAAAAACGAAYAWWPSGQYEPIRGTETGTLIGLGQVVTNPPSASRPHVVPPQIALAPGRHLAIAMIPEGGATKQHPAFFVIRGEDGEPAVALVSDTAPDPDTAPTAEDASPPTPAAAPTQAHASAFPFKLPSAPGPGGTQAVAVNTTDHGVTYKIAYSLVTVKDGAPVTNTNGAYAFASCNACTTVAVSFQVVLVVGTSKVIAPINAAGALNVNCPACVTTAIADQIVVTLKEQPSDELTAKLTAALEQLDALDTLGAKGTPAAIAAAVVQVQKQIEQALADSGQVATTTTAATTTAATTTTAGAKTTTAATTTAATTTTAVTTTTAATTTTAPTTTESTPTTTETGTTTATTTTSG